MSREPRNDGFETVALLADEQAAMKTEMDGNLSANLLTDFLNDPAVTPGDVVEAIFPGYMPVAAIATWTEALNDEGELLLQSPLLTWTAGTMTVPDAQTVVAVSLTLDPTTTAVWAVMPLVDQWPVNVTGESMSGVIIFNVTQGIFTFMRVSD